MKAVGLGRSSVSRLAEYSIAFDGPFSVSFGTHQQPIYQRVRFIRFEVRRKLRHRILPRGERSLCRFLCTPVCQAVQHQFDGISGYGLGMSSDFGWPRIFPSDERKFCLGHVHS